MPRLGFLYPGYAAEDDYPRMARLIGDGIAVELVHTSVGVDAHRADALIDLGSTERLRDGASVLKQRNVDCAVWACTSGSFIFGWEGARRQVQELEDFLAVPASSTSFAFVNAIRALNLKRVSIAATYPRDVAEAFATFLSESGIETVSIGSQDIITATEVGTLRRERVISFVSSGDHPDAEAVLVPDTALHTIEWIEELESALGKPVLTANQVTMWEALRLTGTRREHPSLGHLFRTSVHATRR